MLHAHGLNDRVRARLAAAADPTHPPDKPTGMDAGGAAAPARATARPARVVRIERDRALLVTDAGETTRPLPAGLAVGDWVLIDEHRIRSIAERWSALARTDPRSVGRRVDHAQVLAANVDVVFIVEPLDRAVRLSRLDRALAMVWESGAVPVVVLTKADLHPDPEGLADRLTVALRGVDVIATSVIDGRGDGIDEVAARLAPGRTGVVLGLSGAGKSSLLNALAGEALMDTGEVRAADHRGRHTTTARRLVALPGGGTLIDLPGLRALGLWDAAEGVRAAFDDVDELAADCRFADCAHEREPDCAVRLAIEDGRLDAERLDRWRKLAREAQVAARRQDPALDAAHRAEVRRVARSRRNDPRTRRKR